jgi:hypothetical protein
VPRGLRRRQWVAARAREETASSTNHDAEGFVRAPIPAERAPGVLSVYLK